MAKKDNSSSVLIKAITELADAKEISRQKIADFLEEAITKTYYKSKPEECQFKVTVDIENGTIDANEYLEVADVEPDSVYDDFVYIPLKTIQAMNLDLKVGEVYAKSFDINEDFIRGEAAYVIQLLKQKLIEIDNVKIFKEWSPRIGTNIVGEVESEDKKASSYKIDLDGGNKAYLHSSQTIPGEKLIVGRKYHFLVQDVKEQSKGWPIILSRTDALFAKNYLIFENPEIQEGQIVIEKWGRIAGFKSMFAVSTTNPVIDPAAIVIGLKGVRVKAVSSKLNDERIDIVRYDEDKKKFIVNAIGIDNVHGIILNDENPEQISATVIIKDDVLAKVIGRKGSNTRLIAKLTECNLDFIKVTDAKIEQLEYTPINPEDYKLRLAKPESEVRSGDDILDELNTFDYSMDDYMNFAKPDDASTKTEQRTNFENDDTEDEDYDSDQDFELLDDSFGDLL